MPSRAGILEKRGNMWLAWRQRYFVLKDGKLEYSKIGNTTPSGVVPLTGEWKVYPWKFPGRDHAIILKPPAKGDREFYLSALTDVSKNEWIKDISATIELLADNNGQKRSSVTVAAPAPALSSVAAPSPAVSAPSTTASQATTTQSKSTVSPVPSVATSTPTTTTTQHAAPARDTQIYPASASAGASHSATIEMSSIQSEPEQPTKEHDKVDLIVKDSPKQKQPVQPKKSCCNMASCCAYFLAFLTVLLTGFFAVLATSKLDPESKVWGFIVSSYNQIAAEYKNLESQVYALDPNYQVAVAVSVFLVLAIIVVVPIVCCVRRARRNRNQRTDPFNELHDEEDETRRKKARRSSCCRFFCWTLFTALLVAFIAIVATSALDSNSQIWNRSVEEYNLYTQKFVDWTKSF